MNSRAASASADYPGTVRAPARRRVAVAVLAAALVCGCAAAPVQEMSDARQALLAAEAAGAEYSAPQPYRRAGELLRQAETTLGRRAYPEARRLAIEARSEAIRARERAALVPPPAVVPPPSHPPTAYPPAPVVAPDPGRPL